MSLQPAKRGIDLGIVTAGLDELLRFYRDVVGLQDLGGGATRSTKGGRVHNLACGDSVIKLIEYGEAPVEHPVRGPVNAATGYRYWTVAVPDASSVVASCEADGRPVVVPLKEIGAGIRVAIVEDPDGNWVEFLDERG